MSAGPFEIANYIPSYSTDYYHPIRVQPETLALILQVNGVNQANSSVTPPGRTLLPISANSRGSRRNLGVNARKVRIRFTGTVPDGYAANSIITLPLLNATIATVGKGATGTYLESPVVVVGTTPEYVN